MVDLPSASQISDLACLLAPGLIIDAIRVRTRTGITPDLKDRIVGYGVASVAYFSVVTPAFHWKAGFSINHGLWLFLQYIAIPSLLGLGSAYAYQYELTYKFAKLIKLHIAHHHPAAWDYKLELLPNTAFLLVTLTDGTTIAGRWADGSFASSAKDERDILLGEMWEPGGGSNPWKPLNPPRAVLICGKEIRSIETF
jgi:hypothetical protein